MLYKHWRNGFVSIAVTFYPNTFICCDTFLLLLASLLSSLYQAKTIRDGARRTGARMAKLQLTKCKKRHDKKWQTWLLVSEKKKKKTSLHRLWRNTAVYMSPIAFERTWRAKLFIEFNTKGLFFHSKDTNPRQMIIMITEDKYKSTYLLAHVRCQEHIQCVYFNQEDEIWQRLQYEFSLLDVSKIFSRCFCDILIYSVCEYNLW